jgi:hypothetical protein
MSARAWILSLTILAVWCEGATPADAHRLDEALQATRISIDRERLRLELDVTAGVSIAPRLFASIDTDHDGRLSLAERNEHAREIVHGLDLTIDGTPAAIVLNESTFPELPEMSLGVGTIRVRAAVLLPTTAVAVGRHVVSYTNNHGSVASAYLVNALVPADSRIEIVRQRRDEAQRALTLDYRVLPNAWWTRLSWTVVALSMIGLLGWTRSRGATATNRQSDHAQLRTPSAAVVRAR